MPEYKCECCKFNTHKKTDYTIHLNTKKHKEHEHDGSMIINDGSMVSSMIKQNHICCFCEGIYSSKQSLSAHRKICAVKKEKDEKIRLLEEEKKKWAEDRKKWEADKKRMEEHTMKITEIAGNSTGTIKRIVDNLTYVNREFGNANVLKSLDIDRSRKLIGTHCKIEDVSKFDAKDMVKCAICFGNWHYTNKIHENLVNILIKEYQTLPENPEKQPFWSVDTSRLIFLVRQSDIKPMWINDDKGLIILAGIVEPLIKAMEEIIAEFGKNFYTTYSRMLERENLDPEIVFQHLIDMKDVMYNGTLKTQILKYLSSRCQLKNVRKNKKENKDEPIKKPKKKQQ